MVGAGLGLVYWAVSPAFDETESLSPQSAQSHPGPWESTVNIQVVNPGSSSISVRDIQQRGEYYTAQINSLPFLEFIGQELAKRAPEYPHTIVELAQIIEIQNDLRSEPPAIKLTVTASSEQETWFLATFVPEAFQDYLITEESKLQTKQYQTILQEIEGTRAALLEAEKEAASLVPQKYSYDLDLDPVYIRLAAEVEALQNELDIRAQQLAFLTTEEETLWDDYVGAVRAVEKVSKALSEAKSDLRNLETQATVELSPEQMLAYTSATTRVEQLSRQFDDLTRLALSRAMNTEASEELSYLAVETASLPIPVFPARIRLRIALMMGGILGMGGAWLGLNRKWLATGMASADASTPEEGEEYKT